MGYKLSSLDIGDKVIFETLKINSPHPYRVEFPDSTNPFGRPKSLPLLDKLINIPQK